MDEGQHEANGFDLEGAVQGLCNGFIDPILRGGGTDLQRTHPIRTLCARLWRVRDHRVLSESAPKRSLLEKQGRRAERTAREKHNSDIPQQY